MASPYTRRITHQMPATAAGSDTEIVLCEAPVTGTFAVYFTPVTVLTGANTDSRTLQAFNGGSGAGTKAAEKAFTSGVNAAALTKTVVTATATNTCTKGDIITFKSLHVGSTGLAQPLGLVTIEFTPSV